MHIVGINVHTGACQLLSWTVKLHTGVLGFLMCVFLCISKFLQKADFKVQQQQKYISPWKD